MTPTVHIVGDKAVMARLERIPGEAEKQIGQTVGRWALKLQRHVVRDKLTGQVLNVRTGTLRRSIDQVVLRTPGTVCAVVSTNLEYARRHEYGFKGTETVKAHLRTIKQAWGRPITPREVMVRQHVRTLNLPERSFLRSALADMAPEILADLDAAAGRIAK